MSLDLDICVCTFRRASLAATLRSLQALTIPEGLSVGIVVIDNDDTPSAAHVAEACEGPLPVRYLHRPGRNISLARNAGLEASAAPLLAFIDDDETAAQNWLTELMTERRQTGAEVILGPVEALYPADAPRWMTQANMHATEPVWVNGEIETGYSCNVLIDRTDPMIAQARFDPAFGRTGGEDSFYFRGLTAAGARIAFAPDAWVYEPVTPERLRVTWLARRRVRMGKTHAHSLMAHDGQARLPGMVKAAGKAVICAAMAALYLLPSRARALHNGLRACLHVGTALGLAGRSASELYGRTTSGEPQ